MKQQPPPQQTFSTNFVSTSPRGEARIRRTSLGLEAINAVEHRRRGGVTGSGDLFSSFKMPDGSGNADSVGDAAGVVGFDDALSDCDAELPERSSLNGGAGTVGRSVGSRGIGSLGWQCAVSGMQIC